MYFLINKGHANDNHRNFPALNEGIILYNSTELKKNEGVYKGREISERRKKESKKKRKTYDKKTCRISSGYDYFLKNHET